MQDAIRVLAGDCTVRYSGAENREQRGAVLVVVKPDNTVLVHDASGYQPAAWLTRADTVSFSRDAEGFRLAARDDGTRLHVESHEEYGHAHYPVSPAGEPVGDCPACGAHLVRDRGRVVCVGCLDSHAIPRDATVEGGPCEDCGLPTMVAERGARLTVCIDYDCESLAAAANERFAGAWDCPDCGGALAVRQDRGLRAVCEDCDASFRVPVGTVAGTCAVCGLPAFDGGDGRQCLDGDCAGP